MTRGSIAAVFLVLAAGASTTFAQSGPATPKPTVTTARLPGRPGSWEVSGGAAWLAPGALGSSTATLTANSSSTPFTYFDASARMGGAPGVDVRATYNLTRRVALEGGFFFSRPPIDFTISRDADNAPGLTSQGERLSQYFMDGNLVLYLPKLSFAQGRGRGFIEGGVGYLRQLHDGRYNVDTGTVYNGGAGFKFYFRSRPKGPIKGFGIRADLRAYYRRGGYSFDGGNTWTASLGAAGIVAF